MVSFIWRLFLASRSTVPRRRTWNRQPRGDHGQRFPCWRNPHIATIE